MSEQTELLEERTSQDESKARPRVLNGPKAMCWCGHKSSKHTDDGNGRCRARGCNCDGFNYVGELKRGGRVV